MRALQLATALCLSLLPATHINAATLVSQFTFDSGFTDSQGGASASGSGSVSGGRYNFAANQGLGVSMGSSLLTYSILFGVELDVISGYRKLIDVSGLSSDSGLYNLNGALRYYSPTSATGGTILANVDTVIGVTYDGATTTGYVNGSQAFSVSGGLGTLSAFTMVEDDTHTGKGEATSGTLDFLEVYSGVMSSSEMAAYTGPSPVPLPAGGVLLLTGLLGAASLKRRNSRAAKAV